MNPPTDAEAVGVPRRSDHGTYEDAVRFALDVHQDRLETWEFLNAWNHGDLDEWPEYYEWLDQRRPVGLFARIARFFRTLSREVAP